VDVVTTRRSSRQSILRSEPPLWRVASLVCSQTLATLASGASFAAAWALYVVAETPGRARALADLGPPALTIVMHFHYLRAGAFFLAVLSLACVLWVLFAWQSTGRGLIEPRTTGERLRGQLGALLTGCCGIALVGYGVADRIDVSTSWLAQSGLVALGTAAVASALALACRLGRNGWSLVALGAAVMVLLGGVGFLADRASPPGEFALSSWPNGTFLAGSIDAGQGGLWSGGGFWTERLVEKQEQVTSYFAVSCPSGGRCLAFGSDALGKGVVMASSDAGRTWAEQATVASSASWDMPMSVSCWDIDDCLVGGVLSAMTADGGRTWQTVDAAHGLLTSAVDCPAPGHCLIAGHFPGDKTILVTEDGGRTWEPAEVPLGEWAVGSISCTGATSCVAVASTVTYASKEVTEIWRSNNGGATWRPANLAARRGTFSAVSCNAIGKCLATGEASRGMSDALFTYASSDRGATWVRVATAPPGSLACTLARCTVVSMDFPQVVSWVSQGERSWVRSGLGGAVAPGDLPFAVSCAESGTCLAFGAAPHEELGVIYDSHDGGVTWARARISQRPLGR
jgi:photosystem II stability/assembly factor-like uncharacterized protein